MKAIILAAGFGKRLRPLTLTTPKPLIPLAGKPLIVYHIENLAAAGVRDIVINHSWLGGQIVNALGDGGEWGINITYSAEPEPLETGGGILRALPLLTDNQDDGQFIVVNGDIFSDYPIQTLPPRISGLAHLVMVDNPDFKTHGDFALLDGRIKSEGSQLLTYSGISVLSARLFDGCSHGVFSLATLLRRAIPDGQVSGVHYRGHWTDVGTVDRLQTLEKALVDPVNAP